MDDPNALASPAQTPTDSPEPAATLEPASLQTQDQPGGEPAPVEGGEGGAEKPEPPVWAAVTEASELFDLEGVKPLHEERLNSARETAKKEGLSEAHRRMAAENQRLTQQVGQIHEKIEQATGELSRLARLKDSTTGEPTVDQEDLRTALTRYGKASSDLTQYHQSLGIWEGASGLAVELGKVLKSDMFGSDYSQRLLAESQQGGQLTEILGDMINDISAEAKQPLQDKLKEQDAKITRLETEVREAKRNGQPAPANPPGGAGGGGKSKAEEDEILMNPETHIDVIREITARRKG